ncbi:MAG: restriction endonuclease subunit R [Candidatus Parabeggiatoa sp. nov. 2]|nr:MAG: restriction endonuclease subunit R [Beggiatoa sp. 4572_84]RKZ61923.1 MAG: restriction endonuclease subunit R [Gammaproteobacteria bacterium]
MSQPIHASDISLHDLETQFCLQRTFDENFFSEWQGDLPEITDLDKQLLDRLKAGYFNLIKYPPLLEDTVKMAVLGPLLYFAGFYLYPFHTKSEYSVKISNRDGEVIVDGKIDVLVLKEQFWIMVIESKQAAFSIEAGLAQILAYMLANKNQEKPCFGMITTGGSFVFIKLVKSEMPQYALSRVFELNNPGNDLYTVLTVLKQLEQATLNESSLSA